MTDTTSSGTQKFGFLEGIRGLGCVQVMVIHYISAFLPVLARVHGYPHDAWEKPLTDSAAFAVINGNVTVFLFFLVSAFVLTQSYLKNGQRLLRQPLKRFIRLFLPTAISVLLAIALLALFPEPRSWVAPYARSIWAERLYANPMTLPVLAKDILLNSMLLGYRGASLFDLADANLSVLDPLNASMNTPLWTLHAEFWGSMLVLVLAWLYRALPRFWFWCLFTAMLFVTGSSHFTLFLIGFAGYLVHRPLLEWRGRNATLTGLSLVAVGVFISGRLDPFPFDHMLDAATQVSWLQAAAPVRLQNEVSGLLIMAGFMVLPKVRELLAVGWVMWLGRCSFGLYLVHFPVLFTAGFAVFALAYPHLPYGAALMLSLVVGGSLSLAMAKAFERWIDQPSLRLSNRVMGRSRRVVPMAAGETAPSAPPAARTV